MKRAWSCTFVTDVITAVIILFLLPAKSFSLGFLAHEAIIDNAWEKSINPLLKKKYPKSTDSALKVARSYCYGGSVVADIYAFALEALSHYYTVKYGHPISTNRAVPISFPDLKQEFGDNLTFEQAEKQTKK